MSRIVFHRPARVAPPQLPTDPVVIAAPPQPAGKDSNASWVMLLMPLLSSVSMAGYMIVAGKKMLILLGISFVLLSVGVTVGVRMQMRGTARKTRVLARDRYLEHLIDVRGTARQVAADQRVVAAWQHPSPHRLRAIATRRRRVWERRVTDADFLRVRIGVGRAPLATPIRLATRNDPTVEYDARARTAAEQLVASAATVGQQPAVVDLSRGGVVSLLGPAAQARSLARTLLAQVAVGHAPDDVAVAVVTAGEDWEWAKWLPHVHEPEATAAAGVMPLVAEDFEGIADHVQARLTAAREQQSARRGLAPERGGADPRQRLVVLLDHYDPRSAWARSAAAAQLLDAAGPATGIVVVCVVEREEDEPTRADIRVRVRADASLTVETRRRDPAVDQVTDIVADQPEAELCESIARALAPLRLSAEGEEILAQTVSLPALLGVTDLDTFTPEDHWVGPGDDAVLRVPIGFDSEGRPLELDLKESARNGMGPHGLIVGATGSGKSELLRTLVSGLTTTHSPELLSLVLVDFKGGATFAGVTEVPHVAGLITNLVDDLALVDRVRDALVGEQQRRQRMLRDAGNLDNVREYQLRRAAGQTGPEGRPLEPLPYLLVIVDEFGELLTGRPDFIDLFVQIGRVGRSLGMHLLLASQRLEEGRLRGLDSNLSYRICLRTFSAAESRTVIGTPDAYRLPPIPGSAYLKVAESVYERLRVAHVSGPHLSAEERLAQLGSGAPTLAEFVLRTPPAPDGDGEPDHPDRLSWPAALPEAPSRPQLPGPTEMQVLVQRLIQAGQPVHQVWLPPLPAALPLDALTGPVAVSPERGLHAQWWPQQGELHIPLGVVDVPLRQQQHALTAEFAKDHGHLALVGAPQTGRSTFLRTLMLSAMLTHTPDQVQFLCLDFGGGTLQPYERAPHVSGVAGRHDVPRVRRVLAEAAQLIGERERLFREWGVDSVAEFRRRREAAELPAGTRAADVFLLVDNWGAARGEVEGIDAAVLDIANRGLGVGVHLVLTANRWADLRMALRDSFSARLELRLNDPADSELNRRAARQLVGAGPGRGMTAQGLQFQVALPRLDGLDSAESLADAQQETLTKLAAGWTGRPAPAVRMLPQRVLVPELPKAPEPAPDAGVPIGLSEDDLSAVRLDLTTDEQHLLVYGDSGAGKSSFLRMWMAQLAAARPATDVRFIVFDYRRSLFGGVPESHLGAYAGDSNAARVYVDQVVAKLAERLPPADVTMSRLRERSWWTGPEFYLVVDDYDLVGGSRQSPLAALADYLPQAREIGLHLVAARRVAGTSRTQMTEPLLGRMRELGTAGLLLSGDSREGALVGTERATLRPPGRGLLVRRNHPSTVVQTALRPEDDA